MESAVNMLGDTYKHHKILMITLGALLWITVSFVIYLVFLRIRSRNAKKTIQYTPVNYDASTGTETLSEANTDINDPPSYPAQKL